MNCCICGIKIKDYGNNPDPVKLSGRCCDKCNKEVVIPARFIRHINGLSMRERK